MESMYTELVAFIILLKILLFLWKKHHVVIKNKEHFTFKESEDCYRKYHRILSVYWIHPLLNLVASIALYKCMVESLLENQDEDTFIFCLIVFTVLAFATVIRLLYYHYFCKGSPPVSGGAAYPTIETSTKQDFCDPERIITFMDKVDPMSFWFLCYATKYSTISQPFSMFLCKWMAEGIIERSYYCDKKGRYIDKYTVTVPKSYLQQKMPSSEFSLLDYLTKAFPGRYKGEFTSWDMWEKSFGFLVDLHESCKEQSLNKLKQLSLLDVYYYDNALFCPVDKYMFTEEGKEECSVFFSFLKGIAYKQEFYYDNREWIAGLQADKKTDLLLYTQIMGLETSFSRIAAGFFNESDNLSKAVEHSGQLNYYGESMIKTAMERKGNPRIGGKMWDCF